MHLAVSVEASRMRHPCLFAMSKTQEAGVVLPAVPLQAPPSGVERWSLVGSARLALELQDPERLRVRASVFLLARSMEGTWSWGQSAGRGHDDLVDDK